MGLKFVAFEELPIHPSTLADSPRIQSRNTSDPWAPLMNEASLLPQNDESDSLPASSSAGGATAHRPWISGVFVAICIGIWLALNFDDDGGSWQSLSKWGVLP